MEDVTRRGLLGPFCQERQGICCRLSYSYELTSVVLVSVSNTLVTELLPVVGGLQCDSACLLLAVSELQEEGMNAINLPLSPIPFELDPEDTMLGNWVSCSLGWPNAFEWSHPH